MNALTFVSPLALWGLVLAGLPLLIHLLFRRRYRRVDWAPMRYLRLSLKRHRRRMRIEQWLLLALRTAVLVFAVLAVARPLVRSQGLAGWLAGESRRSRLLVIDDSLSMGHRTTGRPAFADALAVAEQLVNLGGPRDHWTILLASRPDRPLVEDVLAGDHAELGRIITQLKVSEAHAAWTNVLEALARRLQATAHPLAQIDLITDLRSAGWEECSLPPALAEGRTGLRIFDVGREAATNLALLELAPRQPLIVAQGRSRWQAVIENLGAATSQPQDATLEVDGRPQAVRVDSIAAGQSLAIPLELFLSEPGLHRVSVALAGDDQPGDDRAFAVVDVRREVRIAAIDGRPASDDWDGATDFLALALSLGESAADGWNVEQLSDLDWPALDRNDADLIVLADVPTISPAQAQQLARLVRGGAGLMIFLGPQVDPESYNRQLFDRGRGPLPAALATGRQQRVSGLLVEPLANSPLAPLGELDPAVLERIGVEQWIDVVPPEVEPTGEASGPARVLARWNDPEGSPAAVERHFGRGKVLMWTTSADRQWTDWPTQPSYVLAMREAAAKILRTDPVPRGFTAGQQVSRTLTSAEIPRRAQVERPDGRTEALIIEQAVAGAAAPHSATPPTQGGGVPRRHEAAEAPAAAEPRELRLHVPDAVEAGFYDLSWELVDGTRREMLAINPDLRERSLARIPADELRAKLGAEIEIVAPLGDDEMPLLLGGRETWRLLVWGLLVMALGESCFAAWSGRQR